jgi:ABC-type multidrug transport system ATPase subunit
VTAVVRTIGLGKCYGRLPALSDGNLAIDRGEVFGYLGPNGAGKTTTLRLLMGLIRRQQAARQFSASMPGAIVSKFTATLGTCGAKPSSTAS